MTATRWETLASMREKFNRDMRGLLELADRRHVDLIAEIGRLEMAITAGDAAHNALIEKGREAVRELCMLQRLYSGYKLGHSREIFGAFRRIADDLYPEIGQALAAGKNYDEICQAFFPDEESGDDFSPEPYGGMITVIGLDGEPEKRICDFCKAKVETPHRISVCIARLTEIRDAALKGQGS